MNSRFIGFAVIIAAVVILFFLMRSQNEQSKEFGEFQEKISKNQIDSTEFSKGPEGLFPPEQKEADLIVREGLDIDTSMTSDIPYVIYNGSPIPIIDFLEISASAVDSTDYSLNNYKLGMIYITPLYGMPLKPDKAEGHFQAASRKKMPQAIRALEYVETKKK